MIDDNLSLEIANAASITAVSGPVVNLRGSSGFGLQAAIGVSVHSAAATGTILVKVAMTHCQLPRIEHSAAPTAGAAIPGRIAAAAADILFHHHILQRQAAVIIQNAAGVLAHSRGIIGVLPLRITPAGLRLAVLDGKVRERHIPTAANMEHPVDLGCVDNGQLFPGPANGQIGEDIQIPLPAFILAIPFDGEYDNSLRQHDLIHPIQSVGLHNGGPQRAHPVAVYRHPIAGIHIHRIPHRVDRKSGGESNGSPQRRHHYGYYNKIKASSSHQKHHNLRNNHHGHRPIRHYQTT